MKVDTEEFVHKLEVMKEQLMYELVKASAMDTKKQDRLIGQLEAIMDIIELVERND